MQPRDYSFKGNMLYSEGTTATTDIREILLSKIPGARNVTKACDDNDRNGVDYWVETVTGDHLGVDVKVRREDYAAKGHDDLALETLSVVERGKVGWTRDEHKKCHFILWLWSDTRRFCLISFPQLCSVMQDNWEAWKLIHKTAQQCTDGRYHSECIFVPRREVWAAIYRSFSPSRGDRQGVL